MKMTILNVSQRKNHHRIKQNALLINMLMNHTKTVLKLDKSHSLYLPMIIPLFISIKTKQLHFNNPTMLKHVLLFHSIIIQQRIDFWRKATTNSKCASIQEINNIRMKSEILLELMLVVDFILMSILIKQQQKRHTKWNEVSDSIE